MWRDDAYFLDILNAARRVVQYTTGMTGEEFERDDLTQDATMRPLGVIGEPEKSLRKPEMLTLKFLGSK